MPPQAGRLDGGTSMSTLGASKASVKVIPALTPSPRACRGLIN